jgi:predicted dehydrogenase
VQAETDDTFAFTLNFVGGGAATMIASFAATPARGARIVVMGDDGTLIAEQSGPNPMDDGVVIASRKGSALAPLPSPAQYASRQTRAITGSRRSARSYASSRAGSRRARHPARASTTVGAASRCSTRARCRRIRPHHPIR